MAKLKCNHAMDWPIGSKYSKALQEHRIYWNMLWHFFNEIIEYNITNEEPAWFCKKVIIIWIIEKICYILINLDNEKYWNMNVLHIL